MSVRACSQVLAIAAVITIVVVLFLAQNQASSPKGSVGLPSITGHDQGLEAVLTESADNRVAVPFVSPVTTDAGGHDSTVAGPRITGRCIDRFFEGLEGVLISSDSGGETTLSSATGKFVLVLEPDRLISRSVSITGVQRGYGTYQAVVTVHSGQTVDIGELLFEPSATVSGLVVDETDSPVEGAMVSIQDARGPMRDSVLEGPRLTISSTRSDERGLFKLVELPVTSIRVWAGSKDMQWTYSDSIELKPGSDVTDVRLQLEQLSIDSFIDLLVLDPKGVPVPIAHIKFSVTSETGRASGTVFTDALGRCRMYVEYPAPYSFLARDPGGLYRAAVAKDVLPETLFLTLELQEMASFKVVVEDIDGIRLPLCRAHLIAAEGQFGEIGGSQMGAQHEDGVVILEIPACPFLLRVEAEGYRAAELGPFAPDSVQASVTVTLRPTLPFRGRAVAEGIGISGATVSLHQAARRGEAFIINGLPARSRPRALVSTKSDDEGRFQLSVGELGLYFVRAEAVGYAPNDVGPLELGPNDPFQAPCEIELTRPGGIVGRILGSIPGDAIDVVVGASRGDGFGISVRTDARGTFLFEGLTPGDWLVRELQVDIETGRSVAGTRSVAPDWYPASTCVVHEDQLTSFDLDCGTSSILEGRLRFSGEPATGWRATLYSEEGGDLETVSATLASDGRFQMTMQGEQLYRLTVQDPSSGKTAFVQDYLKVTDAGPHQWDVDIPTGQIELSVAEDLLEPKPSVYHVWSGIGRLSFLAKFAAVERGASSLCRVAAGTGILYYPDSDGQERNIEVEVLESEILRVMMPPPR